MGEARTRKKLLADLLQASPNCVFCGGETAAVTVDHVPSISMFHERQRPKGLEFPACEACNNGTRKADLVAALIGRVYPDPSTELHKQEFRKLIQSVNTSIPGILEEMKLGRGAQKIAMNRLPTELDGGVFRVGPILNKHMKIFSLKMGLALHFHNSRRALPKSGGIYVCWFSNYEKFTGAFPQQILDAFPASQTLAAGRKTVIGQFEFSSQVSSDCSFGIHFAGFRQSFAIFAAVSENPKLIKSNESDGEWEVLTPIDFKAGVMSL